MMVYRTYGCCNRNCRNEFTIDGDHPPCPKCGTIRVKWIPKPVAIAKKAPAYDRTIKQLADRQGLTDINEPRAGERAAKRPKVPNTAGFADVNVGGYKGKVGLDSKGAPVPTCLPNGMSDKVQVSTGASFKAGGVGVPVRQGDRVVHAPISGPTPQFVARHKGPA